MSEEVPDTQTKAVSEEIVLHFLFIKILRGEDLPAADVGGKSDPYCLVTANKQTYKTQVIPKTLNPEWNETTTFCFLEPCNELLFEVWDEDSRTKDDVLGEVTLDTSSFFDESSPGIHSGALQIVLPKKKTPKGKIFVEVRARVLRPTDLEDRIGILETETAALKTEIEGMDSTIVARQSSKTQLEATHKDLCDTLEGDKNQHIFIQEEIDDHRDDIEDMKEQMRETEAQTVIVESEIKETGEKKTATEADIAKLRTETIPAHKTENEGLRHDVADLKEELSHFE